MPEFVHLNSKSFEFLFDVDSMKRDQNIETPGNGESSAKFFNFCRPESGIGHSDFRMAVQAGATCGEGPLG